MKLNKEKFLERMCVLVFAILVITIIRHPVKPTTWKYQDYIAEGHTWAEWVEVSR